MLNVATGTRIFVATGATDMRKGFAGSSRCLPSAIDRFVGISQRLQFFVELLHQLQYGESIKLTLIWIKT